MPSVSKKQHNLMEAVAHSPAFAKKVGIKQSVGKDFAAADKSKKFGTGGGVGVTRGGKGMINRQETRFGSVLGQEKNVPNVNLNKFVGKKEGGLMKEKMQKVKTAAPSKDGIAQKGKTKGKQIKMAGNSIGTGPAPKAKGKK
jgi:hypothetical protein